MRIIKCDICHKMIKDKQVELVVSMTHPFISYSFCTFCGKGIVRFLKKHKLIIGDKVRLIKK